MHTKYGRFFPNFNRRLIAFICEYKYTQTQIHTLEHSSHQTMHRNNTHKSNINTHLIHLPISVSFAVNLYVSIVKFPHGNNHRKSCFSAFGKALLLFVLLNISIVQCCFAVKINVIKIRINSCIIFIRRSCLH